MAYKLPAEAAIATTSKAAPTKGVGRDTFSASSISASLSGWVAIEIDAYPTKLLFKYDRCNLPN
jgi:hypothetical protein